MMQDKIDIEELFKRSFENHQIVPSENVWFKLQQKIFWHQFLRFNLTSFNVYYIAVIVISSFVGLSLIKDSKDVNNPDLQRSTKIIKQENNPIGSSKVIYSDNKVGSSQNLELSGKDSTLNATVSSVSQPNKNIINQVVNKSTEIQVINNNSTTLVVSNKTISTKGVQLPEMKGNNNVKAKFSLSKKAGCVPLTIEFHNFSVNSDKSEWNFGDGSTSDENSPLYVFEKPGKFIVSLKISSDNGSIAYYMDTVQVFSNPRAIFEMKPSKGIQTDIPVFFNNNSTNCNIFEWTYNDNSISFDKTPTHTFKKAGQYSIKLKVKSDQECYDSAVISNILVVEPEYKIVFPSAFTPDLSGSNKGYYSERDVSNSVFYPKSRGLATYEMKIFTRFGKLIFKTDNIQIGWDGYYQDKLVSEGVYIWKATGTFIDGTSFSKSGNLTLIFPNPK